MSPATNTLDSLRKLAGVNVDGGLTASRNNETRYLKLLGLFVSAHAPDIVQLESSLKNGELFIAEQIAHTLKGSASTIGLTTIAEISSQLNLTLRRKEQSLAADWYRVELDALKAAFLALAEVLR